MNRVLIITARITTGETSLLRGAVVGGCAFALILAKLPFGL